MKKLENMSEAASNIINLIIDKPEELHIDEKIEHDSIVLRILPHESDVGKVIGRLGANAGALRQILKAISVKNFKKRLILVIDEKGK